MIDDDFDILKSKIDDPELLMAIENIHELIMVTDKLADSVTNLHDSIERGHEGLAYRHIHIQKKILADYINLRGADFI